MRLSCALAILLLSGGGCLFSPGSAAPARALCTEGEAEAALGPLRPTQTASCNYDIAELNRRILSVLALSPAGLGVETIERTFGLPRLHTSFDDSWNASYSVIVSGKAGTDPWQVEIGFDESFFPQGGSHPARFKGTMRPVRIRRRDRGEISLSIQWLHATPIRPDSGVCLPNDWLVRGARRAGWHREWAMEEISDIGPRQRIALEKGRGRILLPVPDDEPCLGHLVLNVEARD